jgi:putative oxidoreductase
MINNSLHQGINFAQNINMKKLLSTNYRPWAFDTMMLLTRLCFGLLILKNHGFGKLVNFSKMQYVFSDPFHIGSKWSLVLVLFAEVFCALLVIAGLFTRLAVLPLVVAMGVAFFIAHNHQVEKGEPALLYLCGFIAILLCGPGRVSLDSMMGK